MKYNNARPHSDAQEPMTPYTHGSLSYHRCNDGNEQGQNLCRPSMHLSTEDDWPSEQCRWTDGRVSCHFEPWPQTQPVDEPSPKEMQWLEGPTIQSSCTCRCICCIDLCRGIRRRSTTANLTNLRHVGPHVNQFQIAVTSLQMYVSSDRFCLWLMSKKECKEVSRQPSNSRRFLNIFSSQDRLWGLQLLVGRWDRDTCCPYLRRDFT